MSFVVPPKIYELLKTVVDNNIDNYSIVSHGTNKKGEGFLGEMIYVSLKDKNNGKSLDFAVKQAFTGEATRKEYAIRSYYVNEIHFYDIVWPSFQKLQRQVPSVEPFDKIPRCFATVSENNDEKLVFENLRYQNFVLFDKKSTFNKEHVEFIFKQYGRFHAISFANKDLNLEEYSEIGKGLKELWYSLTEVKLFKDYIKALHELCWKNLDPEEDAKVAEKYKRYIEDGTQIFRNSLIYNGNYSVILHGDCWSNNMMFKYDEFQKLVDMRLLDFQFSKVGTPVSDLSYCLYSGVSKEILDELDYYLRVYHDTLLKTVKDFGCSTEDVFSFEELKKDWKEYCKMGFTMGLMLWRGKLTYEDDIKDLTEWIDADEKDFQNTRYDEETFQKRARDLILHMYENDFL